MAPPRKIYDFIIEPIRTMDRREGELFLERWMRGPQEMWSRTDAIIKSIPDLWSVTDCPEQFLKYLKWIVGWTSELDGITRDLTEDELRRLISISGRLWKERGSDDTLIDVMFFATGSRCRYWNWFDFRWLLPYVGPPDLATYLPLPPPPRLRFDVTGLVGDFRRDGTPVRVTCLLTGEFEEVGVQWSATLSRNVVITSSVLGQSLPPSETEADYQVRLVDPRGTELGEEHEGRDPWVVDLPDPAAHGAEYESNLRIVDNGALNRSLVVNLVKLMRGSGEKWEITYLGFLDRFVSDGDDTQWKTDEADFFAIAGGTMLLGDATEASDQTECIIPEASWPQALYYARFRTSSPVPATSVTIMTFNWQDGSNSYGIAVFTDDSDNGPAVWLIRIKGGSSSTPVTVDMNNYFKLYPDVYYSYRAMVAEEGSNKRIKVYVDNVEIVDWLDTDPIPSGTIGFGTNFAPIEVDEVEVISLPAESDYVDINS